MPADLGEAAPKGATLILRISQDDLLDLRAAARRLGVTSSALARLALRAYIDNQEADDDNDHDRD